MSKVKFSEFDLRDEPTSNNIAHFVVGYDASTDTNFRLPITEVFNFEGDIKFYEAVFTNLSTVTVNHTLNKTPEVTIFDNSGSVIIGEISHDIANLDNFTVSFNSPMTGTIQYF
jgi:hypothetical protein